MNDKQYQWRNAAGSVWLLSPDKENNLLKESPDADYYYDLPGGRVQKIRLKEDGKAA